MKIWERKSVWIGALLLVALAAITLYIIHKELNTQDIAGALRHADPYWVAAAIIFMVLYFICDGINIRRCLTLTGYQISIPQMMRYAFAGFFFSSITPSSSGGQPGQLYFMYKDKIRLSHGTFSLLFAFLSYQVMAVVWGVIGILFLPKGFIKPEGRFGYVFPLGFSLNLIIIFFLMCILFSRRLAKVFARVALWIDNKHKGPDNKYQALRFFALYRRAAARMLRNKLLFAKILLTSFVQMTLFHSVPFLCAHALGWADLDWLTAVCVQGVLFLSVSSLPLPGATGVTEYGYALFFADYIPENILGSALLLSRFCSFVFPLALSALGLLILQLNTKYLQTSK